MAFNPCPKCGSELEMGYGLAGGGMGPYVYCSREACDYFQKFQDPEMEVEPQTENPDAQEVRSDPRSVDQGGTLDEDGEAEGS